MNREDRETVKKNFSKDWVDWIFDQVRVEKLKSLFVGMGIGFLIGGVLSLYLMIENIPISSQTVAKIFNLIVVLLILLFMTAAIEIWDIASQR